jgi:hypothetical protein
LRNWLRASTPVPTPVSSVARLSFSSPAQQLLTNAAPDSMGKISVFEHCAVRVTGLGARPLSRQVCLVIGFG